MLRPLPHNTLYKVLDPIYPLAFYTTSYSEAFKFQSCGHIVEPAGMPVQFILQPVSQPIALAVREPDSQHFGKLFSLTINSPFPNPCPILSSSPSVFLLETILIRRIVVVFLRFTSRFRDNVARTSKRRIGNDFSRKRVREGHLLRMMRSQRCSCTFVG